MIRDRTQRVGREAAEPIAHQRELATLRLARRTADPGANVVGQALGLRAKCPARQLGVLEPDVKKRIALLLGAGQTVCPVFQHTRHQFVLGGNLHQVARCPPLVGVSDRIGIGQRCLDD